MKKNNPAIILGSSETALGVARSLGEAGIKNFCFDFKKGICFYSRYSKGYIVPHPITERDKFLKYLLNFRNQFDNKPVLFVTSDDFLRFISDNTDAISDNYLINITDSKTIKEITNKYSLYLRCKEIEIEVPQTYPVNNLTELEILTEKELQYPLFLKGSEVNTWRKKIHSSIKGFLVNNKEEFIKKSKTIIENGVSFIVQELVIGPDKNHFKCCAYYSQKGEELLIFTLRKLLQNPIHYGVGAIVESIEYPQLKKEGRKLFRGMNYRGVGSAEFKLDERDGKLKLIEINPRYWQQNYLSTRCGMNFPLTDYTEVTGQSHDYTDHFKPDIKWINIYMSLDSFLDYRKNGEMTFKEWMKLKKGRKVYADFTFTDPIPSLYELGFGKKLLNIPKYAYKRIFH